MKKITLNLGDIGQYYKPIDPVKRSYKKTNTGAKTKAPKSSSKSSTSKASRNARSEKGTSIKTSKPKKSKKAKTTRRKKTPEELEAARALRESIAADKSKAHDWDAALEADLKAAEREYTKAEREYARKQKQYMTELKRDMRAAEKSYRAAEKQFDRDNRDFEKVAKLRAKAALRDEGIAGQGRRGTYTSAQLEDKMDDLIIQMYDKHLGKLTQKEINNIKDDPEFSKIAGLFPDSVNNLRDKDTRNAVMANVLGRRGEDRVISLETKSEVLMKMFDFEADTRIRYDDPNEVYKDVARKTMSKPMLEMIKQRILNSDDVDPTMKEYIKAGDLRTVLAYINYRAAAKKKSKNYKNYNYATTDENYAKDESMMKMYVKSDSKAVENLLNYQMMYAKDATESKRILRQAIKSGTIESVDILKEELESYKYEAD